MSTWTMRDKSAASIFTGWAQRVNGSYSLFNTENFWTLWGSVSDCSAFCCRAEFCPLHQPAEERQTDRQTGRRAAASEGSLLPWIPCLAYLTPVSADITGRDGPLRAGDPPQYPGWTLRRGQMCAGWGGFWFQIMMTENFRGRKRDAAHL